MGDLSHASVIRVVIRNEKTNMRYMQTKMILFLCGLLLSTAPLCAQVPEGSLQKQMEWIHTTHHVDFVYNADVVVNQSYQGPTLRGLTLEKALATLFQGTGISWSRDGRYVILKQSKATKPSNKPLDAPVRQRRFTISGYVKDAGGESLINATVYDLTTRQGTTTNEYGFYSITLPEGRHRLRLSYLGFEEHEEAIHLTADRRMDISLQERNNLAEVVVTGDMNSPLLNTQTGKRTFSQKDIKTEFSLLSSPDVVKTVQRTSGVAEGVELASGLYVHGGNNDENLFLLDGTPLYQINHSMGLFSSFNADVVKNVDFYKSGFPARYGGRLSSVMDVRTADGDLQYYHGSYRIGLLDGSFQLEGPIQRGKTSFNLGLRRSWLDLITTPVFAIINRSNKEDKININYNFHDLNAKIVHLFSDRSRLSLSTYWGRDHLFTKGESLWGSNTAIDRDVIENRFNWGNFNMALDWNYVFSPKLFANFTGVYTYNLSRFNTLNDYTYKNGKESTVSHSEHGYHSTINDLGYRMAFDYRPLPSHHLRFGHDLTYHWFRPQTFSSLTYFGSDTKADTLKLQGKNHHGTLELNAYMEDEWTLNDHWSVDFGANLSLFDTRLKQFFCVDPRVAMKYQAGQRLSFKASYTMMTQFVHKISNSYIDLPTDYWVPTTERLHPMRSGQLAVGAYYQPTRHWLLSLEGYYKESNRLLQYANWLGLEPPADAWDTKVSEGRGRFYGVEADVRYQDKRLKIDAAYTLSWNRRRFDDFFPEWYYDKFDNRHKFNITMRCRLSKGTHFYAGWIYRTGNRMTAPTQYADMPDLGEGRSQGFVYERPNNIVLPAYHRLDLGFDIHHKTKRGRERVWNWSIYNAYCHFNTLFVNVKYDETTGRIRAKAKGYIPIIPSFSYTIKF